MEDKITAELLNTFANNSMIAHLGIEITALGEDYISGKMPVDHRTIQPFGILHGGASMVLAETLGSYGSYALIDKNLFYCVGLEINANHIRSVKSGYVFGHAVLLHLGRKTHVWKIDVSNEAGKLVCTGRFTVAVLKKDEKD